MFVRELEDLNSKFKQLLTCLYVAKLYVQYIHMTEYKNQHQEHYQALTTPDNPIVCVNENEGS